MTWKFDIMIWNFDTKFYRHGFIILVHEHENFFIRAKKSHCPLCKEKISGFIELQINLLDTIVFDQDPLGLYFRELSYLSYRDMVIYPLNKNKVRHKENKDFFNKYSIEINEYFY